MASFSGHSRLASAFASALLLVGTEKAACAILSGQAETATLVVKATGSIEAGGGGAPAVPLEPAPTSSHPADSSVVRLAEVVGEFVSWLESADVGVNSSADGSAVASTPDDANVGAHDAANLSAPADFEADAGAEEDNATAAPAKGRVVAKVSSSAESEECRSLSEAAGLTCCSAYTRTATRPGCRSGLSWAEAKAACKAKGMELCSKAFIHSGLGKGVGCPELDGTAMWTSEECVVPPLQVSAATPASTPNPPAKGWVYVLPHTHSAATRERPEDSAFTYYQFEPLKVRGHEQVIEIAEIVFSNNGWQVSTSGATVSTPSGATNGILLVDGNVSSVWIDMKLEPITIKLIEPASVDGFGFVTGNVSARDPVRWKFKGSFDGSMWTTLHDQAEDYAANVQRREIQGFVFGEQRPTIGAAEPPVPAPDSTTGEPNASIYSDSLLNRSWTSADNEVTEEAAAAARNARVESAEQKFREAVGSGPQSQQTEQEKEKDKPDTALVASLSTFGAIALLLAGGAAAMYMRPRADQAERRDKAPPARAD